MGKSHSLSFSNRCLLVEELKELANKKFAKKFYEEAITIYE